MRRYLSTLLLGISLMTPVALNAQRYYDRDHRDRHEWNEAERRAYRHYLREVRKERYRDWRRMNERQRAAYWRWRHENLDWR